MAFHNGLSNHQLNCFFLLSVQLALLSGYAWLLQSSIRQIHKAALPSELEA
jgi:hypothetical protein